MVVLFSATTAAISIDGNEVNLNDISQEQIDEAVQEYNDQYTDKVPGLVKSLVNDERINVNISTETNPIVYGAVLNGMEIQQVEEGGIEDPTLKVYVSTDTIETIAQAENPRKRAVTALKQDEIRYETVGFWRGLKYGVISTLIKIFG